MDVFEAQCLQTSIFFKMLTDLNHDQIIQYEYLASSEEHIRKFIASLEIYNGDEKDLKQEILGFVKNNSSKSQYDRHDTKRNSKQFIDIYKKRLNTSEIEKCTEIFHQINGHDFYNLDEIVEQIKIND